MADKKKGFVLADVLGDAPDVFESNTPKGPLVMKYVDIDDLHPSPLNKKAFPFSEVSDLIDLILLEGSLQQPLYVTKDGDGWEIKSGHRRYAALKMLIAGFENQPPHPELRRVPIVYKPDAAAEALAMISDPTGLNQEQTDRVVKIKGDMALYIGNIANRPLTGAQLDAAAQQMEAYYVELNELGARFPGRLRSRVAAACQTSAAKLAKLKVIREKLTPPAYRRLWESGKLPEQTAYAIARMEPMLQEAVAKACPKKLPFGHVCENIQKKGLDHYFSRDSKCPDGKACENGQGFLSHDAHAEYSSDFCHGACCAKCPDNKTCQYACAVGKAEGAKKKTAEKKRQEADAERAKKEKQEKFVLVRAFVSRLAEVIPDEKAWDTLVKANNLKSAAFLWGELKKGVLTGELDETSAAAYYYPSLEDLVTLCRALGVSADWLLGLPERSSGSPAGVPTPPSWRPGTEKPDHPCWVLLNIPLGNATFARIAHFDGKIWLCEGQEVKPDIAWWLEIPEVPEVPEKEEEQ